MGDKHAISIWFIIGSLLLLFGIIIFGANVTDYFSPWSGTVTVLHELHAGIWWGLLLIVIGLVYVIAFNPKKTHHDEAA